MRLTTKSRFAVTALIDLGLRRSAGSVTLMAIGQRHQISLSYLEQIFSKLRCHGLVKSIRGPGGGYILSRGACDISIAQIVAAVDELDNKTQCCGKEKCSSTMGRCMTHDLWTSFSQCMHDFLQSVTLQSLINKESAKGVVIEDMKEDSLIKKSIFPLPMVKPMHQNAPNSVFAWGLMLSKVRGA